MFMVELGNEHVELEAMIDRSIAGENVLLRVCDGVAVQLTPVEIDELAFKLRTKHG